MHFGNSIRLIGGAALVAAVTLATPTPGRAQQTVTPSQSAAAPTAPSSATASQAKPRRGANSVEARIADLHKRLQITPDQEAKWKDVADVMRQNAQDVEAAIKDRAQNMKTMTAIDDLKSYEKIAAVHEDGMKRLIPAFQALYDSMPDAQKKNADNVFRTQQRRAARAAGAT